MPRQLPGDVRSFVNRARELAELDTVLDPDAGGDAHGPVWVIVGTAGVGKTSLALHWAHQARALEPFPDGQLYVNLRGYDPGTPVTPVEALTRFLRSLHVPARSIPTDPEAAAALYRSVLAGRRMLVILDNAATTAQVRPLLPGTPGCLVLITSRSRLSGLVARDGAHRLTLDVLEESEAVDLLRAVTRGYRSDGERDRLVELARLCARLPLALRIAAERAASRPRMELDALIADLRDESSLWDALSAGDDDEADAVRSVFAWSYRALPREAAQLFRLLGLHPGPEFSTWAAGALADERPGRVRHLLDVLVGAHLLEQHAPDRYAFHDLLRAYATDQAHHEESPESGAAAFTRLLDWYLHTADAAQSLVGPPGTDPVLDAETSTVPPLAFKDYDEALGWYEWERTNLLNAARAAERAGHDRHAWQLPAVLRHLHAVFNPFDEWLAMGHIGLRAARRTRDRDAEAEALENLGTAYTQSYRLAEGAEHLGAALEIRRAQGSRTKEAFSLNALGLNHLRARELREADGHFVRARRIFEGGGDRHWTAVTLSNLSEVRYELGHLTAARESVLSALAAHRRNGNPGGEGNALHLLSAVQHDRGEYADALRSAEEAVAIARERQNHMWEGYWLLDLGRAQRADGRLDEALVSYQRAASLERRLGDRGREARAWQGTGGVHLALGRVEEAAEFHRVAAGAQREIGDRWQLALALDGLADALDRAGTDEARDEARGHWAEAAQALAAFPDDRARSLRARVLERTEQRREP
ncbi:ATP-binding protein [Streptomyces sp. NPDC054784]